MESETFRFHSFSQYDTVPTQEMDFLDLSIIIISMMGETVNFCSPQYEYSTIFLDFLKAYLCVESCLFTDLIIIQNN